VDLGSNLALAAEVYHADQADSSTVRDSVTTAQINLSRAGSDTALALLGQVSPRSGLA
jgi:hypothetical protein